MVFHASVEKGRACPTQLLPKLFSFQHREWRCQAPANLKLKKEYDVSPIWVLGVGFISLQLETSQGEYLNKVTFPPTCIPEWSLSGKERYSVTVRFQGNCSWPSHRAHYARKPPVLRHCGNNWKSPPQRMGEGNVIRICYASSVRSTLSWTENITVSCNTYAGQPEVTWTTGKWAKRI